MYVYEQDAYKKSSKAIPVTGCGRIEGWEMLRIPHCLDSRLTVNCLTARYWLLVAVLTVQFVPHRKHTP
jgi:hypothetical protein